MGRTIEVAPPVVNAYDVLDYAHALIEEHGWRQGPRADNDDWDVIAKGGLSLHDAVGMACYRLSGEASATVAPEKRASRGSKDFNYDTKAIPTDRVGTSYSGSLRTDATSYVYDAIAEKTGAASGNRSDVDFNDNSTEAEVIAVLEAAMSKAQGQEVHA